MQTAATGLAIAPTPAAAAQQPAQASRQTRGSPIDPIQWLTLVVSGLTILVVITSVIDSTLAALIGVAAMCWIGIMTEAEAFKSVDWNVMAILVGI